MNFHNYRDYYNKLRLDELGIPSYEQVEELEYELELRFQDFTHTDRKTWLRQNAYLEHFSETGTATAAARKAGLTVGTAQRWERDNVLGFARRIELAILAFTDGLQEKALLRASAPDAPVTLLIQLLRANIPEKFSTKAHKPDAPDPGDLLRHFRENAHHEMEAGYPYLRKIAEGAANPP